ncbi:MAG: SDR family NAD(P)-dependent oxidoreductase [Candidatus Eremiobacteraeota bacterium]|nr:SDR family NAD(P)-dependent oxidoreductase [Candidatus Eremiobacteraeota bacterium]
MKNARERVAIVTGASSGIGMALAERAVRAGWNVLAVGRRAERLTELAATVEYATGTLATLALDLRSPKAAARIVQTALERFGRIDVLVNNAGGVAVGSIAEQSDAALYEQMETHVIVPLALTREALPSLRASKGQIFFVGSGVARVPVSSLGAYPPAKAAVRNMARVARSELRSFGITVTYVDPGAVASEFMTRAGFAGPPASLAASPYAVARKIFKAFHRRQDVVNAVPWQTFCVAVGEALPNLTDSILRRAPQIVVGDRAPSPLAQPHPQPHSLTLAGEPPHERAAESPFDAALSAHAARMKKFNLSPSFVRGILVPDARLELGDVAMRWAGMPNKHERALTNDVLDALASAGFLEHVEPERYRVVRSPD